MSHFNFVDRLVMGFCLLIGTIAVVAQTPIVSDAYPLTLEENDFPAAAASAVPVTFQTAAATRNRFVLVFRNGILQRPCLAPTSTACDYQKSGNVSVTFPSLADQDLVTILFYR